MRKLALALLVPACAEPEVAAPEVRVEPQPDNALRFTATARVEGAGPHAEVRRADGEAFRTPSVPGGAIEIPLFGLRFDTDYEVEVVVEDEDGAELARSQTERFTTSPRPDDFPVATVSAGPTTDLRFVLLNFAHTSGGETNRMYLLDAAGEVVWYQDVLALEDRAAESFWDGYGWDPEAHTLLALIGHRRAVEQRLDGALVGDWALEHLASHEVRRWEGRIYLPVTRSFEHEGQIWLEDGYAALGAGGAVERVTWLRDAGLDPATDPTFTPRPRAGAYWGPWLGSESVDWTHINAVDVARVDGREKVFLSLKNLNQVVRIDAETGRLDWRLGDSGVGGPSSAGDFAWDDGGATAPWFGGQHGLNRTADGTLLLFDNGNPTATSASRDARALELLPDEGAGAVSPLRVHDLGLRCPYRGSAFPLGDGGELLVTCGSPATVRSYTPEGAIAWEATFACPAGWSSCSLYRGVPVDSLGVEAL